MTREEVIANIKKLQYPCRGYLPAGALAYKNSLLANSETKGLATQIDEANRGRKDDEPFVIKIEKPNNPRMPHIAHLSNGETELYNPRPPCGSNFMQDLLIAGPFDGLPREYTCPKCKVTGVYYTATLK